MMRTLHLSAILTFALASPTLAHADHVVHVHASDAVFIGLALVALALAARRILRR